MKALPDVIHYYRNVNMSEKVKSPYNELEGENKSADDGAGSSSDSAPSSLPSIDPGAQIEMSAAVAGVVPDGECGF